jgi:lipopolysaccharide transport system permease protein
LAIQACWVLSGARWLFQAARRATLKIVRMQVMATQVFRWPAKRGLRGELAEVLTHRDLLLLLVQKDLKVKYKGTTLGFIWSLLNPLLMMIVYTVVFSFLVRFQVPRYPVFLLSGLLAWNCFASAIGAAGTSLIAASNLVRRVRFPLEFLPLTSVLSTLVNFLLSLAILVVFALAFRQTLGPPLLLLPLLLVLQTLFTIGVSLVVSALLVYFRDVEYLVSIGLMALFFLTPVIYPLSAVPSSHAAMVIRLNPLTWLITSYQNVWHDNLWPSLNGLLAFAVVSVAMLLVGRFVFRRLEGRFAEEV